MVIEMLNASRPWDILPWLDKVTHYWFGDFLLIIFFLTAYLSLGKLSAEKAFAGSAFFVNVIAVIFWYFEIVNTGTLIFTLAGLIISVVFLLKKK